VDSPPFFSIITPVLNGAAHIPGYLRSLLKQKWQDWEAIVVDDGSTDGTYEALLEVASYDYRFKIIKNVLSRDVAGPWQARNIGLDAASGKYICFLDIDDQWFSCKLEAQMKQLTANQALGLLVAPYYRFRFDGWPSVVLRRPPPAIFFWFYLLIANPVPMLTACVGSSFVSDLRFRPVGHEDYLFWRTLLSRLCIKQIFVEKQPLAVYRVDRNSLSGNKFRSSSWIWSCYRQIGYSRPIAALAFLARGFLQLFIVVFQCLPCSVPARITGELKSMLEPF
jgi:teichuronic acid biosynthesis glycosyltransferase TuaG